MRACVSPSLGTERINDQTIKLNSRSYNYGSRERPSEAVSCSSKEQRATQRNTTQRSLSSLMANAMIVALPPALPLMRSSQEEEEEEEEEEEGTLEMGSR